MSDRETITADRLLRRVRMHTFDLASLARAAFTESEAVEPTCRPACAYCCYQKVLIDAGSGAMLYLHLLAEGRWTPALEARLVAADREMAPVSHADWLPLRRPCVFLKERGFGTGRCTVYPVRPVNCALTFSKTADPAACAVPGGSELATVLVGTQTIMAALQDHEALLNGAGETKTWLMTLPAAVLYGRALVEGMEKPPVCRVAKEDAVAAGVNLWDAFDEAAAGWYGETGS